MSAYYSIYRPQKDERLSWLSWSTYSGRFIHISGHPSAAGQAQDRKVCQGITDVLPLCYATNLRTEMHRKISVSCIVDGIDRLYITAAISACRDRRLIRNT